MKDNPYALSFGKIPNQYIRRDLVINEILDSLNSENPQENAFKLTGIRGAGKTVTLTAIERELKKDKNWIIVDLKSTGEITKDLIANLYSEDPFLTKFVDTSLNLSLFGVGLNLSQKSPVASEDYALKTLIKEIKNYKKRILVVIDEVQKTPSLVDFIQEFQILIREDLPIFLLVAGIYEDMQEVENTDGLTFFLRAASFEMSPLSIPVIRESYRQTMNLDEKTANEMAKMTKGYAYAYQTFGYYMWESEDKTLSNLMLSKVDYVLSEKVYKKIWNELTSKDKWYLSYVIKKDIMPVAELLDITKTNHSDWSIPRKRLAEKGIIDLSRRGEIEVKLPRFKEFVQNSISDI